MRALNLPPRALVLLLAVCSLTAAASGATIQSGATYYIKLKRSTYCQSAGQYVGYNNKKCGENGPLLRKKDDGSMSWKRWVVAVKKKESPKSWIVTLTSTYDPRVQKPTCLGLMTVTNPGMCQGSAAAAAVKIASTSTQQWRMVEVATNTFTIAATNRVAGCLRFLGASGNCSAPALKLYKVDDRSGTQRFVLEPKNTPSPSPSPSPSRKKAGKPINVRTTTVTTDTWSGAWTDGAAGVPVETYNLVCVRPGDSCEASPAAATEGIRRGTGAGSVVGLAANTPYDCYVIATNAAGFVCSSPVAVKTSGSTPQKLKPEKPSGVNGILIPAVLNNNDGLATWSSNWTAPAVFDTVETCTVKCLSRGTTCDSTATFGATQTGIPRATNAANITGLPVGRYSCYVIGVNSAGSTCSDAVSVNVTTPFAAGQPTGVTGTLSRSSWSAKWTDGSAGAPQETYTVKCVSLGAGCNATAVGTPATGIARGVQAGDVNSLPRGSAFSCYVIAVNSVSAVCSATVIVSTGGVIQPGKPTAVTSTRTSNSVALKWTVGTVGAPEEQYAVKCVAWPGKCGANPLGMISEGIPRSAGTGNVTALPPSTRLNCYVIAYNSDNLVNDLCSAAEEVVTLALPRDSPPSEPTNVAFIYRSVPSSATVSWLPGPEVTFTEQFESFCVAFPGNYTAELIGTPGTGTRAAPTAIVSNLPAFKDLNCYVAATNSVGTVYGGPFRMITDSASFAPGPPINVKTNFVLTETSTRLVWSYSAPGNPVEDYQIRCYPNNGGPATPCSSNVGVVTSTPFSRVSLGPNPALDIFGLTAGTTYDCYVRAKNLAGEACSPASLQITTLRQPSRPGDPSATAVGATAASISFAASTTSGVPEETYAVRCYVGVSNAICDQPLGPGDVEASVPRLATGPVVVNIGLISAPLASGRTYTCVAIAKNFVSICAQSSVTFTTTSGSAPGPATNFALAISSESSAGATVTWTAAAKAGSPAEDYYVKCWNSIVTATSCQDGNPAFTFGPIARGAGGNLPTTLTGMTPSTTYRCFLGARNAAVIQDVCANTPLPVTFTTKPDGTPGRPIAATGILTGSTFEAKWTDGTAGTPFETYAVKCVPQGYPCDSVFIYGAQSNIPRGTEVGIVTGLTPRSYFCYVMAANSVGFTCSDPINVNLPATPPGKPAGITYVRDLNSVTMRWTVGSVATPQEQYALRCVAWPGSCSASATAVSTPIDQIPRSAGNGTITLASSARANCYVVAYDPASSYKEVCSDPVDVSGVTPGQPTNVTWVYNSVEKSAVATWIPGALGVSLETYVALCVQYPNTYPAPLVGSPGTGRRVNPTATVTNVPAPADLNCYVYADNTAGTTFSAPYRLTIN